MHPNSKIYVAGHTGLIGSAVVRCLRHNDFKNLVLRTHSELDLTSQTDVNAFFSVEKPEYVIYAAGKVGGIAENKSRPADFIALNLMMQVNVLSASHQTSAKRVIYFGSSCMYPKECQQPMSEDALFNGMPEQSSMAYAVSKMAGVQMCLAYNQQFGSMRFIPIIPNSAYGPNDNFKPDSGHVLSALITRFHEAKINNYSTVTLWGTGAPLREFVHADDIADACLVLLKSNLSGLELPLNIGCGVEISIKDLASQVAEVIGYSGKVIWDVTKPDGAPRKLLNSSRINRFGWLPTVALKDGIASTYGWYLKNIINGGGV